MRSIHKMASVAGAAIAALLGAGNDAEVRLERSTRNDDNLTALALATGALGGNHSNYTALPYRERNDSERLARAVAKRERRKTAPGRATLQHVCSWLNPACG